VENFVVGKEAPNFIEHGDFAVDS